MDMKPAEMNERLSERVDHYLPLTCNCAQSSFGALRDAFGFEDGGIFKALTPFPGLGRGETCGAVTGCVMALGLLFGNAEHDLVEGRASPAAAEGTKEFCDRFEEQHSSLRCREILEYALGSGVPPDDQVKAAEWTSRMERSCSGLVQEAVRTAARIIVKRGTPHA
jgi:C_GCAxxG_C_C family probable redox protein